jgi:hypothetical protein
MKDRVLANLACLDCGALLDRATGLGHNHRPKPGDIKICFTCGHIMAFTFTNKLTFRPLTDAEMVEIAGDPVIVKTQTLRAAVCKIDRKLNEGGVEQ